MGRDGERWQREETMRGDKREGNFTIRCGDTRQDFEILRGIIRDCAEMII